ncbi:TIGR02391 family protein [uncultured Megasphaera sp.]|uniref:TIGR02391 family protein n=1 Tax=Megasphaera massiliensis TaxID=1232428 RepID=UPI00266CEF01|nr:TIGR02391 family protein [uncultured Megasphaera sp.]
MITYLFIQLEILEKIQSWAVKLLIEINEISDQDDILIANIRNDMQREADYTLSELKKYVLPYISEKSNLLQHFSYTQYFIEHIETKKDAVSYIKSNITSILLSDLPTIRNSLKKQYLHTVDAELLNAIEDLLKINKYTEAAHDAFKLLSKRFRESLHIPSTCKDGDNLLAAAFSEKYKIKFKTGESLTEKERRDFQNLLKGSYALVRNLTAHDFIVIQFETAGMAIATINYVLKRLAI